MKHDSAVSRAKLCRRSKATSVSDTGSTKCSALKTLNPGKRARVRESREPTSAKRVIAELSCDDYNAPRNNCRLYCCCTYTRDPKNYTETRELFSPFFFREFAAEDGPSVGSRRARCIEYKVPFIVPITRAVLTYLVKLNSPVKTSVTEQERFFFPAAV